MRRTDGHCNHLQAKCRLNPGAGVHYRDEQTGQRAAMAKLCNRQAQKLATSTCKHGKRPQDQRERLPDGTGAHSRADPKRRHWVAQCKED